jgi:hypothetical protein
LDRIKLSILLYHLLHYIHELPEKDFSRIAAKHWQAYIKERNNKGAQSVWKFIEIILQIIKWIIHSLERFGLKKRRTVQKISVE